MLQSRSRLDISIQFDEDPDFPGYYTNGDLVKGTATLTVAEETHVESVEICIEGKTSAIIPQSSWPSSSGLQKAFMFSRCIVDPNPRIFRCGKDYCYGFAFRIPNRLSPRVCPEADAKVTPEKSHLNIPPTLGDREIKRLSDTWGNDLIPKCGTIFYRIHANALGCSSERCPKRLDKNFAEPIRVIPRYGDTKTFDSYRPAGLLQNEVIFKHSQFGSIDGILELSTSQPRPMQVSFSRDNIESAKTALTLSLRFYPANQNSLPPRLSFLRNRLTSNTSLGSLDTLTWNRPDPKSSQICCPQSQRCNYVDSTPLSTRDISSVMWVKEEIHIKNLSCDNSSPSLGEKGWTTDNEPPRKQPEEFHYKAQVVVPVILPDGKTFVPDFESCLASRSYTLEFFLSYQCAGLIFTQTGIPLSVPISIIWSK